MQFEVPSVRSERIRKSVLRIVLGLVAVTSLIVHSEEFNRQFSEKYHELLETVGSSVTFSFSAEGAARNENSKIEPLEPFETVTNPPSLTYGLEQRLETTRVMYDRLKQSPDNYTIFASGTNLCLPGNMVPESWQQYLTVQNYGGEIKFRPTSFFDDGDEVIACGYVYPEPPKSRGDRIPIAITRLDNIVEDINLVSCDDYLVTTGNEEYDFERSTSIPVNACSA